MRCIVRTPQGYGVYSFLRGLEGVEIRGKRQLRNLEQIAAKQRRSLERLNDKLRAFEGQVSELAMREEIFANAIVQAAGHPCRQAKLEKRKRRLEAELNRLARREAKLRYLVAVRQEALADIMVVGHPFRDE